MNNFITNLKANFIAFVSLITAIGTLLAAFIFFDTRYALAQEVKQYQQDTANSILNNRKDYLEDKIFEIEVTRKVNNSNTPIENALYNRYKQQLNEITTQQQKNIKIVK